MASICILGGAIATVDDCDFEYLSKYRWYLSTKKNYAITNVKRDDGKWISVCMHRMILGLTRRLEYADHIDGNGLNNVRSNLRRCTPAENGRNRKLSTNNKSGLKGVSWNSSSRSWQAHIKVEYESINLGTFKDPLLAHKAYCDAAEKFHGNFAKTR